MLNKTPRGIRNNNPGNIRRTSKCWRGEIRVGPNLDPSFCVFDTPEHGIRALAIELRSYYYIHKLQTIGGIIARWAPSTENDTNAYANFVAKRMGLLPASHISFNPVTWTNLCEAIIQNENGRQPYSEDMIMDVCKMVCKGL